MQRVSGFLILAVGLALAQAAAASPAAQAQAAKLTPVSTVDGVSEYRLDNGLRVVLAPDASRPTLTVNLVYLVGSRHEQRGENGWAHLLANLTLKGTPRYPHAVAEMVRRGMSTNGSGIAEDYTIHSASFAARESDLEWYLRWSADAMFNAPIDRKNIDEELMVIRNVIDRKEREPHALVFSEAMGTAFRGQGYAQDPIGTRADLDTIALDALHRFYRQHYRPDNAVLVIAGDFDEVRIIKTVARTLGRIPRPAKRLAVAGPEDPRRSVESAVTLRDKGAAPIVLALYAGPPSASEDAAALNVLVQLAGAGPASRLYQQLVSAGLAVDTSALLRPMRDASALAFVADLPIGAQPDKTTREMLEVVEGIASQEISDDEVGAARRKLLGEFEREQADSRSFGGALAQAAALGDWRLWFFARDRLSQVTTEEVKRAAAVYLVPENRTLGLFEPTESPRPALKREKIDVATRMAGNRGDARPSKIERIELSAANIDARTERAQLANGMRLAMLPRPARGHQVNALLRFHLGDEAALSSNSAVGEAMLNALCRGTQDMTRPAIRRAFDDMNAALSKSGDASLVEIGLQVARENLEPALRLLAKCLRKANFDDAAFEEARNELLVRMAASKTDPQFVALMEAENHGNPYPRGELRNPGGIDDRIADLRAVKIEAVKRFYAEYLGADHAEASFAGDFDASEVKRLMAELFGNWKSATPYRRVPRPYYPVTPASLKIEIGSSANEFYAAVLRLPLQDTDPEYPALYLANFLLGAGPGCRLWARAREKEGLLYSIKSYLNASAFEPHARWRVTALFSPKNLGSVESAIRDEIERARKDGFTAQELAQAKEALVQIRSSAYARDSYLVDRLAINEELGRSFAFEREFTHRLQAVTLEEVNAAFRKYVDPRKLVVSHAGDLAKSTSEK